MQPTVSTTPAIEKERANGYANLTMALGQMLVTVAFVGVTVFLFGSGQQVPAELWTLDVAIVSFYIGQRVHLSGKA